MPLAFACLDKHARALEPMGAVKLFEETTGLPKDRVISVSTNTDLSGTLQMWAISAVYLLRIGSWEATLLQYDTKASIRTR